MKRILLTSAAALLCLPAAIVRAQTSYPMLMSLHPVAAQVGRTSELTLHSRYSMHGAYQVLVTGEGVTGEIATPMQPAKDGKTPNLTQIKVRFTVADDALPGVRDVRIATPRGVSTLGQLVVVRDPVAVEQKDNNTPGQAQAIALPATVCGSIERNEDVDYYRFEAKAGQALSFHVRSMRLEDKIHDLQTHADPILALKNPMGTTLAQSDNHFAGDPFLSYRFDRGGEYLLEIRDVRYQGNRYWEYSIEISDRPFVANVFPTGVAPGSEARFEMVGVQLPRDPTATLSIPDDAAPGARLVRLPLDRGGLAPRVRKALAERVLHTELSNPVPVVVSELPLVVEAAVENDSPAAAQAVSLPVGISGRIESDADLDCYSFEAKKGERFSFETIASRLDSALDANLRILDANGRQLAQSDDLQLNRRTSPDSRVENWTAPADGRYVVELRDLHLRGGPEYVYFLEVTRARPGFDLYLDTDKTQLTPGTSGVIFARAVRKNGFAGEIELHVEGLPAGVTASCGRILAGKEQDGCIVLTAAPDATMSVANITVTGTATHTPDSGEALGLTARAVPQQEIYMPGGGRNHWHVEMHTVAVGAPSDIRAVALSTYDITLKPGESKQIEIRLERAPGFDKNVTLNLLFRHLNGVFADTLPPSVTIDAKKSNTLLTGKQSSGHITLTAARNASPVEKQQTAVMANIAINFVMKATYSSPPLTVSVTEP